MPYGLLPKHAALLSECGLHLPASFDMRTMIADDSLWDDLFLHQDSRSSADTLRDTVTSQLAQIMTVAAFFGALSLVTVIGPSDAMVSMKDGEHPDSCSTFVLSCDQVLGVQLFLGNTAQGLLKLSDLSRAHTL